MPDERQHESADLRDYQVLDGSDTLDDGPGSDPLDRGVVPPSRWTTALRTGSTAQEQQDGESLDQLLGQEEPDTDAGLDLDDDEPAEDDRDEGATDRDIARLDHDDGPDPRAGRLVATDDGDYAAPNPDLVASDAGADGGGASAEEAALHVVTDDEFGPEVP
ncbi:MAG TPA: DUF5709 domain-containing protein [Streptosporangiaceae bacterium]|jgi:hypothetical protein